MEKLKTQPTRPFSAPDGCKAIELLPKMSEEVDRILEKYKRFPQNKIEKIMLGFELFENEEVYISRDYLENRKIEIRKTLSKSGIVHTKVLDLSVDSNKDNINLMYLYYSTMGMIKKIDPFCSYVCLKTTAGEESADR